jgi:hypothetical protein
MVDRFQTDVTDLHPDVVVILAGTNDVHPYWILYGDGGNWDTCHNIAYMVTGAQLLKGTFIGDGLLLFNIMRTCSMPAPTL